LDGCTQNLHMRVLYLGTITNKRGIATGFRSQPRIEKIHDTVAVELLVALRTRKDAAAPSHTSAA
jgi:hypothetical protein